MTSGLREPKEKRFWDKVRKGDGCWEWTASLTPSGYGQFNAGRGRPVLAHRFSYELAHNQSADGFLVCHTCDNRKCCNPAHLFLGTHLDNNRDMIKKGRRVKAWTYTRCASQ